ncbi:MAG TPA: EscU/YscU/HrcU family type III secretion system export apparatus switch protein [Terriglobia bacterium]|nr:EscU/YscU/HrcU family type III secretion system export apparatus switch protein [Terriglobia bacterium]
MSNPDQPRKAAALQYDRDKDRAPKLVAKGQGNIAEKILQIAQENQIPIQQDPSLVEILSRMDLLEEIPPECYRVVAEILAFIYRTQDKIRTYAR